MTSAHPTLNVPHPTVSMADVSALSPAPNVLEKTANLDSSAEVTALAPSKPPWEKPAKSMNSEKTTVVSVSLVVHWTLVFHCFH